MKFQQIHGELGPQAGGVELEKFQFSSIAGTMEPQGGNQRMFAMLETMREEQENLNRELAERGQEKTR